MAVGDGEREGSGGDGDDDGDCNPVTESVTEAVTEAATAAEMLGEEEPLVDTLEDSVRVAEDDTLGDTLRVIATVADAATVPVKLDVWLLTAEPEGLVDGAGEGRADIDGLADAATEFVTLGDALAVAVADATTAVNATNPLTVGTGADSGPSVRYFDACPAKRAKLGDAEPGSVQVARNCGKHVTPLLSGT